MCVTRELCFKEFFVPSSLCAYRIDCVEMCPVHNHILTELLCITPKDTLKHRVLLHLINLLHLQGKVKTKQLIALHLKINYVMTTGQNVKSLKLPLTQMFLYFKKIQKAEFFMLLLLSVGLAQTDFHTQQSQFFCEDCNAIILL